MHKKPLAKFRTLSSKKRTALVLGIVLIIATLTVVITSSTTPEHSIAAYCKVYKEENTKLANANGDTYGVTVFSHKSNNPKDFVAAFSNLEQVAPDDIRPDVKTLQQVFQKIDSDSSQALSASLSGISAESSVKNWTTSHCTN